MAKRRNKVKREQPVAAAASSLQPTVVEERPGQWRVRIPRDYDPTAAILLRRTPQDIAEEAAIERLTTHMDQEQFDINVERRRQREKRGRMRSRTSGE